MQKHVWFLVFYCLVLDLVSNYSLSNDTMLELMRRLTWACYVDGHFVYSGDDPIRIKMCINHVRINLLLFGKNLKSIKELEESYGTMKVFFFFLGSSRHQLLEENMYGRSLCTAQ